MAKQFDYLSEQVEGLSFEEAFAKLSMPTDFTRVWYNIHSGSEEPLGDLLREHHVTPDGVVIGDLNIEWEYPHVLDHWRPKMCDPNPVVRDSLTVTESDLIAELAGRFDDDLDRYTDWEVFRSELVKRSPGGTLTHGMYDTRRGMFFVRMHDGRRITLKLKQIFDFHYSGQLSLI